MFSAHEVFKAGVWSKTQAIHRAAVLSNLARDLEDRMPDLAKMETLQTGRAIREMNAQVRPSSTRSHLRGDMAEFPGHKVARETTRVAVSLINCSSNRTANLIDLIQRLLCRPSTNTQFVCGADAGSAVELRPKSAPRRSCANHGAGRYSLAEHVRMP